MLYHLVKSMIPVAKPVVDDEEIQAVTKVLETGMLAEGKVSREFENRFRKYIGTDYATVTNNGTTALVTALEAMEIQPGDEIITSPFTFIASANTIAMIGAIPIFVDVNPHTYNIDPDLMEGAITKKTRAIMPIHIFGMPCEMKQIMEIAKQHDILVIEDACQAHGATIDGKMVGSFGDVATFSFYATKNLMTGEGGMIVTDNEDIYDKALMIKNHGRGKEGGYKHYRIGSNYRMMDLVAALGIVQLERMPSVVKARRENAKSYNRFFSDYDEIRPQKKMDGHESAYHIYSPLIYSEKVTRDQIIQRLHEEGIGSRTVYAIPCHKQETYRNMKNWRWSKFVDYPDYTKIQLPKSEEIGERHFDIPVHPGVTKDDMNHIFEAFNNILS
jgi:perosamine synthetase